MNRIEKIAFAGIGISVAIIGVVAINDNRSRTYREGMKSTTGKKPFMTDSQQETVLKLAILPVSIVALLLTAVLASSGNK